MNMLSREMNLLDLKVGDRVTLTAYMMMREGATQLREF